MNLKYNFIISGMVFDRFVENKFGKYMGDVHITSISEFTVYKQSHRHDDPVRRLLCLTETCLLERDPATYSLVSLRPLSHVRHTAGQKILKSPAKKVVKSNKSISRNCIFGNFKLFPSSIINIRTGEKV